jgi:hypothetical protein
MHTHTWQLILVAILIAFGLQAGTQQSRQEKLSARQNVLWTDPGDVPSLDFQFGSGGRDRQPQPPFQFVDEDSSGTNPKINVTDSRGWNWNVKWGEEASPTTFCTRLVWACGYFTQPEYFLAHGRIDGVHGLKRARSQVAKDGSFVNARFQLRSDWPQYMQGQHWKWTKNPFAGTHEFQGLKVLVLLVSNWDPKESNLSIFEDNSTDSLRYFYANDDWGATLGKWGGRMSRSKWDCKGFTKETSKFVALSEKGSLRWGFRGKNEEDITSDITVDDVRWLLQYLGRITDKQIIDGLAASGADPENVDCFARALRMRIEQLQRLASQGNPDVSRHHSNGPIRPE